MRYDITVASAFGVESLTKRELIALGIQQKGAINGRFHFSGTALDVARCNMFLRTAERVYIRIGEFKAETFDDLFDGVKSLEWENFLATDGKFIVNGKSIASKLFALSSCQSIIKKAIIDRMSNHTNCSVFGEHGAIYKVEFTIHNDNAVLYLDTSGAGLHKRGYRDFVADAPIRETLASALLMLSDFSYDKPFIDPFCGSGTLPIEAAQIALNIASGNGRDFDFMAWDKFDSTAITLARQEAKDTEKLDRKLRISGFDIDNRAIKLAMRHANKAGVDNYIHLQVQDVKDLSSRFARGFIVTNPPYGERLLNQKQAYELYKVLGDIYKKLDNWSFFVLTSAPQFERYFGKRAEKTRKLYSSQIQCRYYQYFQTR